MTGTADRTTDPAAILAGIRERAKAAADLNVDLLAEFIGPDIKSIAGWIATSALDVPRLLAAVEKVLELHRPGRSTILGDLCARHANHRFFSITRTEAGDVVACPDCTADVYVSCAGCGPHVRLDSCPDRTRITAALTRERLSEDGNHG